MQVAQKLKAENFSGSPLVVLHYGTTWVTKHWPLVSWQALANKLIDELGIRPVLTWGNDQELSAVQSIQQACNNRALVWPRGSLKDLTALLARADLVVGSDTGPIHIAAAVGTSTVSIFRVTRTFSKSTTDSSTTSRSRPTRTDMVLPAPAWRSHWPPMPTSKLSRAERT